MRFSCVFCRCPSPIDIGRACVWDCALLNRDVLSVKGHSCALGIQGTHHHRLSPRRRRLLPSSHDTPLPATAHAMADLEHHFTSWKENVQAHLLRNNGRATLGHLGDRVKMPPPLRDILLANNVRYKQALLKVGFHIAGRDLVCLEAPPAYDHASVAGLRRGRDRDTDDDDDDDSLRRHQSRRALPRPAMTLGRRLRRRRGATRARSARRITRTRHPPRDSPPRRRRCAPRPVALIGIASSPSSGGGPSRRGRSCTCRPSRTRARRSWCARDLPAAARPSSPSSRASRS